MQASAAVFFFGQAGDFQRVWLADADGNVVAEDNHTSLTTIACPPNEPRQTLPPGYNALVTKLKAQFDAEYQEYLASGGTPHHLSATQRWALDTIHAAYSHVAQAPTPFPDAAGQQTKLERLRKLWSITPLDGRVEFARRGLRFQKPALAEAINRLECLAFEHKLDVLADRHAEARKLATEPELGSHLYYLQLTGLGDGRYSELGSHLYNRQLTGSQRGS